LNFACHLPERPRPLLQIGIGEWTEGIYPNAADDFRQIIFCEIVFVKYVQGGRDALGLL